MLSYGEFRSWYEDRHPDADVPEIVGAWDRYCAGVFRGFEGDDLVAWIEGDSDARDQN